MNFHVQHLHIIQCKTIELSTLLKMETERRSCAFVITVLQLKCTSKVRSSVPKYQSHTCVARRYVYAVTIKASWAHTFLKETCCSCKTFAEYCQISAKDTRYRHATAYNTEKDSSTIKDLTSHTNTEVML